MKTKRVDFKIGQKVLVWYKSVRAWKVARIRSVCQYLGSPTCTYAVECEGRINTHWYRAEELKPMGRL